MISALSKADRACCAAPCRPTEERERDIYEEYDRLRTCQAGAARREPSQSELRAVNHRYLDCTVKAPRQYGFLDDAVKKAAAARIARGKVEVYIGVETQEGGDIAVTVNHAVAERYLDGAA